MQPIYDARFGKMNHVNGNWVWTMFTELNRKKFARIWQQHVFSRDCLFCFSFARLRDVFLLSFMRRVRVEIKPLLNNQIQDIIDTHVDYIACVRVCVCSSLRFQFHASKKWFGHSSPRWNANNFRGNKSNMCFPVIADFLFFFICLRDLLLLWFLRGNASDSTGNKSAIETVQFLHAWH